MTIGNALAFIKRGLMDSELRNRLNSTKSSFELLKVLGDENLKFSAQDFEEAFRHRLTQCQEEEEAVQLNEFKMWWFLLSQGVEINPCGNGSSGCRC